MKNEMVFKRYEIKYKITLKQKQIILNTIRPYMQIDEYGRTTIRNIYYDTDNFRLIRRSLEKPMYKEKLRVRSYELASPDKNVFVELKKKYDSVVYKRRIKLPEQKVTTAFEKGEKLPISSQIGNEIEYVRRYYENLKPKVFLSYEREAFFALDKSDLRITFDENILYRDYDLSLCKPVYGTSILEEGYTLMEIKTSGGIPLWLTSVLTKNKIFKTSFSKYGFAYLDLINNKEEKEIYYGQVV